MFKKNDIVRMSDLPSDRSLSDDHPVKRLLGTVGFIEDVDATGKRFLFQAITKDGRMQLFPTWLPWWCFEREPAIEWRVAQLNYLAQVRADIAKHSISLISPDVVAAVDDLRKLYEDTLRVLHADNGLIFTVMVFLWPSVVEAILLALQAGPPHSAASGSKPEAIPNE